ncbi:MAG: SpoIIE family protein phosphatase [Acidobacteria bacterium]|nr:SpoIIE family protein phosphatase [Acidobacteriota bacterium]
MIDRRVLPQSSSQWAKNVGLALALGGTIGLVLGLQDQSGHLLLTVAISAWIGLCIYLTCIIALAFLSPFLDFEARFKLWMPLGLIFFVSSGVGFFVGAHSVEWLTFGSIHVTTPGWSEGFAFAGVLGLICSALWFTYERMKGRLEESIVRLKDQELAEQELETARKIQRRILPPPTLEGEGFRLAALNLPARVVAGDFYDVLPRADGALGLIVADVVGKGLGASLIMAGVKARLGYIAIGRSVTETMEELNRVLLEELGAREFVALCYACYEPASGRFELANAGLPDPYVLKRGAAPQAIAAEGPRLPLGVRGNLGYRSVEGPSGRWRCAAALDRWDPRGPYPDRGASWLRASGVASGQRRCHDRPIGSAGCSGTASGSRNYQATGRRLDPGTG